MSTHHDHSPRQWHQGEEEMHRLLHVPPSGNPTIRGLPDAYAHWMAQTPLLALGTVDDRGRVWTTLLGGQPGVTIPIAPGILGVSTPAHLSPASRHETGAWTGLDPVLNALLSNETDGAAGGKLVAGLAIDLEERTRVKLAGRMVRGIVRGDEPPAARLGSMADAPRVDVQMAITIDETLGNCPKYLNRKTVWPHEAHPALISDSMPLNDAAVRLIDKADIFFISSRHGDESMDTNNRGGAPGFVRVLSNSAADGVTLVYPEYSGNRLLQTLGNLTTDPAVGVTFPDFETGDILYLTGRADILVGVAAAAVMPHSTVAVRIEVDAARFVEDGLFFRGRLLDPSPYDPPVRPLAEELGDLGLSPATTHPVARATLVGRTPITPTVARYTFALAPDTSSPGAAEAYSTLEPWRAGQHVTLDFSADLDRGWSHMRDHDPASLNDDYIRSFTITSAPPQRVDPAAADANRPGEPGSMRFEITVREHGPVTEHLAEWKDGADVTAAVLGFGSDNLVEPGTDADVDTVVVAAGVGITPLVAQAAPLIEAGCLLRVLWSVRADDLPLAIDILRRIDGLAPLTTMFITGEAQADHGDEIRMLEQAGARVRRRRMQQSDLLAEGAEGRRSFFVSVGPDLRKSAMGWLGGQDARFTSFTY
ncbi:pyridoxamine 5'-phosphate oxidase family protein [Herbiconiux ginsengi]|uniref:Pyridoxamine 5'-phosphate oxidase n=1 Tax=Herbiconiux ginsengi TaxID=381665 RepID=A0A1H3S5P1_9MICO|nr:pyridoxamine 5'-phosphate oxidase family protein [Herbiconiux ginsengi]SDZ32449.1 Pyridoxamine 5'-phosphate oxidase [Herbiconiux ginsengi]